MALRQKAHSCEQRSSVLVRGAEITECVPEGIVLLGGLHCEGFKERLSTLILDP